MKFRKFLALVLAVLTVLTLATVALAGETCSIKVVIAIPGDPKENVLTMPKGADFTLPTYDKDGYYIQYWQVVEYPTPGQASLPYKMQPDEHYTIQYDADLIAILGTGYEVKVVGSYATNDGAGRYRTSDKVEIHAGSNPGYRFVGWTTDAQIAFGDAAASDTFFTMISGDVTVEANWEMEHRVTVSDSGFGSVVPSTSWAIHRERVKLDVFAPFGFTLSTLTVTTYGGRAVAVKRDGGDYYFVMPDEPVKIDASFMPVILAPVGVVSYDDVADSAWYADAVDYVTQHHLMDGTGAGKFSPSATTTRAMLVTILYRLDGAHVSAASAFSDVPSGTWYSEAVAWANDLGLVTGYGDGTFGPGDPITREQMAVILQRYAACLGYDVTLGADLSAYQDASSISAYAADAMAWAKLEGLINGVGNNLLKPKGNATRAEIATILQRFCENLFV